MRSRFSYTGHRERPWLFLLLFLYGAVLYTDKCSHLAYALQASGMLLWMDTYYFKSLLTTHVHTAIKSVKNVPITDHETLSISFCISDTSVSSTSNFSFVTYLSSALSWKFLIIVSRDVKRSSILSNCFAVFFSCLSSRSLMFLIWIARTFGSSVVLSDIIFINVNEILIFLSFTIAIPYFLALHSFLPCSYICQHSNEKKP